MGATIFEQTDAECNVRPPIFMALCNLDFDLFDPKKVKSEPSQGVSRSGTESDDSGFNLLRL